MIRTLLWIAPCVVVVVIALPFVFYHPGLGPDKANATRSQIRVLQTAIDMYWMRYGELPSSLGILCQSDPENVGKPYLWERMGLIDLWGKPYWYAHDEANGVQIWTNTPNDRRIRNQPVE